MSAPEPKPLPMHLAYVTREEAALSQLETAIYLWFQDGDPTSIHTLAAAVEGILIKVAHKQGVRGPTIYEVVRKKPVELRRQFRNPQNFFKHGEHEGQEFDDIVPHVRDTTALLLGDLCGTFHRLFRYSSPLFDLFLFRYSLLFPDSKLKLNAVAEIVAKSIKLDDAMRLCNPAFFDKILPLLTPCEKTLTDILGWPPQETPPEK